MLRFLIFAVFAALFLGLIIIPLIGSRDSTKTNKTQQKPATANKRGKNSPWGEITDIKFEEIKPPKNA